MKNLIYKKKMPASNGSKVPIFGIGLGCVYILVLLGDILAPIGETAPIYFGPVDAGLRSFSNGD